MSAPPRPPAADRRAIRGAFSRIGLAAILFLVANVVVGVVVVSLFPSLPAGWTTLLTSVLLYAVGTACFYLPVRGIPYRRKPRTTLPFSTFLVYLCIGYFFLIAGNLIGTLLTLALDVDSMVDAYLLNTDAWASFLPLVVLAPVCEELMFRKLILDRAARYGRREAVVLSALLFALMHGNLSQAFYAFGLGLVLGTLYLRTRNLWYTIAIHAFVNLMQGVLPALLMRMAGGSPLLRTLAALPLSLLAFGLAIAGLVLLVRYRKRALLPRSPIPRIRTLMYGNAGVILFFLVAAIMFAFTTYASLSQLK